MSENRDYQAEIAAKGTPKNAEEHRELAGLHDAEKEASFERCDTDGFVSQWAHGMMAEEHRLAAQIEENGGKWQFRALFDLDGNMVAAKEIETRYGWSWMLLDENGKATGQFFNESKAKTAEVRKANNAKKGFYLGKVLYPAYAKLAGGGKGMGGALSVTACVFPKGGWMRPAEAQVVDNGKNLGWS